MEDKKNEGALPKQEPQAQEAHPEESAESLKKQLEEMTAQYNAMREIAARAQADGINYRNWSEREMSRLKVQGGERAVLAMLPVFDTLEMALKSNSGDAESLKKGVSMVLGQFESALKSQGVKVLNPEGEDFSPMTQEALAMAPVSEKEQDGKVQSVHRKGFQMGEKVIRPAQVLVGRYVAPQSAEE